MKSIWKWIIGVLLVLIVVGFFVSMAFLMHGGFIRQIGTGNFQEFKQFARGPMMGQGQIFGNGLPGGMMGGFGFASPFLMVCRFFMRLVPLALLALVVFCAYRLGTRRASASEGSNVAVTSSLATQGAGVSETPAVKSCHKCGGEVQEGWRNCPMCGTKQ